MVTILPDHIRDALRRMDLRIPEEKFRFMADAAAESGKAMDDLVDALAYLARCEEARRSRRWIGYRRSFEFCEHEGRLMPKAEHRRKHARQRRRR